MQMDVDIEFIIDFVKGKAYELSSSVSHMKLDKPYHTFGEHEREEIRQNTDEAIKLIQMFRNLLRRVEPELIRRQKEILNTLPDTPEEKS